MKNKKKILAVLLAAVILCGAFGFAMATGRDSYTQSADEVFEAVTDENGNTYWVDEAGNRVDESLLPQNATSTASDEKNIDYAPGMAEYQFDLENGDTQEADRDNYTNGGSSSDKNFESATFAPPADGKLTEADAKAAAEELLGLTDFTEFGYYATVTAEDFSYQSASLDSGVFEDREEQVWTVWFKNNSDGSDFYFELNQETGAPMRYGTY